MSRRDDLVGDDVNPDELLAQRIAREFQQRWPARIEDHLPPPGRAYARTVVLLCNIDLELRWTAGREGRAADYFRRFPDMWDAQGEEALDLIAAEYELRRAHARLEEFCRDYADRRRDLAEELGRRFPPAEDVPRYRDLRLLARGGLGDVFVARDERLGREVALKKLQRRHRDDRTHRDQFLFEAETTGRLEHPGIIPVYGLERGADGDLGYAMRLIGPAQGKTLRAAIGELHGPGGPGSARAGARGLRELLGRFVFACRTVDYAHGRCLHGDIKPENILVGGHGETWVIDWGIATPVAPAGGRPEPSGPARAEASISRGTCGYRSPEQARGDPELGPASDVYSLGATLDSLLTGRDRARAIREGRIRDEFGDDHLGPSTPGIPPELRAIRAKAMALRAETRYPTAAALAEDVQAFLDGERVAAWDEPPWARARRLILKHQTAAVSTLAALALAVLLAGSLGYVAYQRRSSELKNQGAMARMQGELIDTLAAMFSDDVIKTLLTRKVHSQNAVEALRAIDQLRKAGKATTPEAREDWAILMLTMTRDSRLLEVHCRVRGRTRGVTLRTDDTGAMILSDTSGVGPSLEGYERLIRSAQEKQMRRARRGLPPGPRAETEEHLNGQIDGFEGSFPK